MNPNPDAAAEALRRAGYEVHRLGPGQHSRLYHPRDDFIECVTPARRANDEDSEIMRTIMAEVESIVEPYDGRCDSCETVDANANYVPFKGLFGVVE